MNISKEKINILLAETGLTQTELAARAQISRTGLSGIIAKGMCRPVTAGKIANAFGVSVKELA